MTIFLDHPVLAAALILALIGAGMFWCLELGRRAGRRHLQHSQDAARAGLGALEASLYTLFGLLLAFTFSGVAERFHARRTLILDQVKSVKTAWMRLDLLPEPGRSRIRELVRGHLTESVRAYTEMRSLAKFREDTARIAVREEQLWREAVAVLRLPDAQAATYPVSAALSGMFDARDARAEAIEDHPPLLIHVMLLLLAWVCSFLSGFSMAEAKVKSKWHIAAYIFIISLTMYVIFDLEFPRLGLFRGEAADEALQALLKTLG